MTLFNLLLVAILQGVTEFLPISSSGHLILLPALTGMADQGLAIDVAVHVGTLGAVVLYFRRDVRLALCGLPSIVRGKLDSPGARLALHLVASTIPVIIAGAILMLAGLTEALRSIAVIGWTTLVFGLVLYIADRVGPTAWRFGEWTLRHAAIMGLWQVVALIPGTSRSGITITGGRLLGYGREDAARLSMLMSIPTILASGVLLSFDVMGNTSPGLAKNAAIAGLFAFGAALVALKLMFALLRSVTFTPYVIYRVFLGLALLAYAYL